MSDLKTTIPGAIVILSGGTKKCVNKSGAISYASTTYEDGDAFGLLGGYARVEAGAILARKFPKAFVITTSCRGLNEPTHASIMAEELKKLGVFASRIVLEEKSTNTLSQIIETLDIVFQRRWENIFFITNKYHVPRVRALYGYVMDNTLDNKKNKKKYVVNFISAESILSDFDETAILVRLPGSRASPLTSITPSAISGTSSSKSFETN